MNFTKDLILAVPLSVYNNNIIKFTPTDNQKSIVNCIVSIGDYTFELTPNLDRSFKFNLKTIAKVLTNENNFNDTIEPDISISVLNNDSSLYHELSLTYKINFIDGTFEQTTKVHKFIKSVQQIIRNKSEIDSRLFPLLMKTEINYSLTYFEGYPFDFSFYSDIDRDIKIVNKNTQTEVTISVTKGVNRFFVSEGNTNVSIENILHLYIGFNELEFKIGTEILFTIILKKVDAKDGIYLKYFNQSGSYSYWLFPKEKATELSVRTISELNKDFESFEVALSNVSITGKTGNKNINTVSQLLSRAETNYLEEIHLSPKVYLLTSERYAAFKKENWSEVKIKDTNLVYPPKATRNRIALKIVLPKLYTQTL